MTDMTIDKKSSSKSLTRKLIPYLSLVFSILFFSGIFFHVDGIKWLSAFDYTTLGGSFGTIKEGDSFVGAGGISAKAGFLFALSLVPGVMLALGVLEVLTHYGAMKAAQRLMSPFLKPLLGLPGLTGLPLITDLQSTDAGAALTKELKDRGEITTKDVIVMSAWQYSGAGLIANYFTIGSALFVTMTLPIFIPLAVMFVLKFVGAGLVRIVLSTFYKKDFINE